MEALKAFLVIGGLVSVVAVRAMSYEFPASERLPANAGVSPEHENSNVPKFSPLTAVRYVAPDVTKVEMLKGDPFVEVYLSGRLPNNCFSQHEIITNKMDHKTRFVVRFRRPDDSHGCDKAPYDFRIKLADLDPNLEASKVVEVLGHKGWSQVELK